MAKIMLVEDDNNLREIYEARLLAEGYEIISAQDGEEALAIAVKERPDLIISDVMMPKISGFDMLDILRSTPETKDTKVIMMTALSQAEDKARADKLGADRYLVKSQVTLEDVAKVTREVLGGEGGSAPGAAPDPGATPPSAPTPDDSGAPTATPPAEPPAAPEPPAPATPPADEPAATAQSSAQETAAVQDQIESFVQATTTAAPAPTTLPLDATNEASTKADQLANVVNDVLAPTDSSDSAGSGSGSEISKKSHGLVLQPSNSTSTPAPDLDELLKKEQAKEAITPPAINTVIEPATASSAPAAAPEPTPSMPDEGTVIHPSADPHSIAL